MQYYAEINDKKFVLRVICVDEKYCLNENNIFDEKIGSLWCKKQLGGDWIRTSDTGEFRKNYAGIGDYYDEERDAFITPKPFENWIFDEVKCQWVPPIPRPKDKSCFWNQEKNEWTEFVR